MTKNNKKWYAYERQSHYSLDKPFGVGAAEQNSQADFESNYSDLQLEGRYGNSFFI